MTTSSSVSPPSSRGAFALVSGGRFLLSQRPLRLRAAAMMLTALIPSVILPLPIAIVCVWSVGVRLFPSEILDHYVTIPGLLWLLLCGLVLGTVAGGGLALSLFRGSMQRLAGAALQAQGIAPAPVDVGFSAARRVSRWYGLLIGGSLLLEVIAYSSHRDQSVRRIVISEAGDRDRSEATLLIGAKRRG